MHPIVRLTQKPSRLVVGFMSGTSADGVDAALVRIEGYGVNIRVKMLAFCFTPFSDEVRGEILRLAGGGVATAADFCRMNFLLGELYCEAGERLCEEAGVSICDIDLIGNHGQTFWHIPVAEEYLGRAIRGTMQLGEDAVLAERFRCPVVGDFRVRDMAAGGLGAPLVPYTEFLLYRSQTESVALQNIGGIGNITVMPANCTLDDILAFDTGPGNMVIDEIVRRITNGKLRYDDKGLMAARGEVNLDLLSFMTDDEYIKKAPPKTTGRERYGAMYVDSLMEIARSKGVCDLDTLRTATLFTARTISLAISEFSRVIPSRFIAAGGGSRNDTLMADIKTELPYCDVMTLEDIGHNGDAKEAVAFAVLANEAIFANANNAPKATGARYFVVMGKISV